MAGNAIDELVSTLYEMIQDAGGVPLFGDRCGKKPWISWTRFGLISPPT
jgi:hypothetical protein